MKKLLSGILASTMLLSTLGTSFAQETTQTSEQLQEIHTETLSSYSGELTDLGDPTEVRYLYDPTTGTLTISGSGRFTTGEIYLGDIDMNITNGPWTDYRNDIKTLVIEEGITGVDYFAFAGLENLTSVTFPNSLESIGYHAFQNCFSLTEVYFPANSSIGPFAFQNCTSLTTVHIPARSEENIWNNAFDYCAALTTVYYGGNETDLPSIFVMMDSFGTNYFLNANWVFGSSTQPSTPSTTFPDWATSFVDFIQPQIMPDITTTNYDDASSRGLIAQSLYRMSGNGGSYATHFTDGGDNASAIGWCYENGIMSGKGENWFDADGNLTREEFALVLKQMADVLGKSTASGDVSALSSFSDQESISSWAKEGMAWAVSNNLMTGNENALSPTGSVTRLEVAVMLMAFDKL